MRKLHEDCAKSLEDNLSLRSVLSEAEGSEISLPKDFNTNEIRLVGKVGSAGATKGILRHKGWKAERLSMPKAVDGSAFHGIIAAAEVEVR